MEKRQSRRLNVLVAVITLTACVAALKTDATAQHPPHNSTVRAPLIELRSIDQLKEAFDRDGGKVRMVVLVSPT